MRPTSPTVETRRGRRLAPLAVVAAAAARRRTLARCDGRRSLLSGWWSATKLLR